MSTLWSFGGHQDKIAIVRQLKVRHQELCAKCGAQLHIFSYICYRVARTHPTVSKNKNGKTSVSWKLERVRAATATYKIFEKG